MKIRTAEELQEALDSDLAWRKKELINLFTNVKTSKPHLLRTNIRVGVVMLYAHWEGFIKSGAEAYLSFVSFKKLTYAELSNNFIAVCLKQKIKEFSETNKNTLHTQLVDFLLGNLNISSQLPTENIIKTQSNLSSSILKEILSTIGVDYSHYELKERLIDSELLKNRNTIAHGQETNFTETDFNNLYNEITNLMTAFKIDILNNAVLLKFKKLP